MRIQRFAILLPAMLLTCCFGGGLVAQELTDAAFAKLHTLIKPQAGESRWMEIDWHPSVWEARKKAAAEGKPLFLMAGSGGAPAAGC